LVRSSQLRISSAPSLTNPPVHLISEKSDGRDPLMTALREFTEETRSIYTETEFALIKQRLATLLSGTGAPQAGSNAFYLGSSKYYVFVVEGPYLPDLDERFAAATKTHDSTIKLTWVPLVELLLQQPRPEAPPTTFKYAFVAGAVLRNTNFKPALLACIQGQQ